MKNLGTLLDKLSEEEQQNLRDYLVTKQTVQSSYINSLLGNPGLLPKQFVAKEKITQATFNKSKSLAYDMLVTWIAENVASNLHAPADVLWWFTSKGLYKEGWEYFLHAEKKLQHAKNYHMLNALYTEGMRLQIYIGNLHAMEELRDHAYSNSIRLMEYTSIQSAYSVEIARLEDATLQPTVVYERKLRSLYKQAHRADHHNLVSNTLYCLFVYYTRHDFSLLKADWVTQEMIKALRRYSTSLTPYGKAILANNIAQFAMLHEVEQTPDEYIVLVEQGFPKEWQNLGKIGTAGYYVSTNQIEKAKLLRQGISMENIGIEKEIAAVAKLDVSLAWYTYKNNEMSAKEFTKYVQAFYKLPGRRVYRELDFMVRVNEILFLVHQREFETALAKCESLRKFSERTMHKSYQFFAVIVAPYITAVQALCYGKIPKVRSPKKHIIRWTRWAISELQDVVRNL
ncbi:MAG: hypothetical protein U0Y96_14170 [Candidatus Kapaibacterium sp.]|nr:hypothetical protein [Bacteroidota bacterium]